MPTSATGTDGKPGTDPGYRAVIGVCPRFSIGFTLIEVLVVVAIIGIILAVAAINLFPDEKQSARREASDVALAIEHARDAAWFGGLPAAITFEPDRVQEWRLGGNEWRADGQHALRLPANLRVGEIRVDGQVVAEAPRLLFLSDGLGTPFRVDLNVRGMAWAVEGDAAGAIRLVEP